MPAEELINRHPQLLIAMSQSKVTGPSYLLLQQFNMNVLSTFFFLPFKHTQTVELAHSLSVAGAIQMDPLKVEAAMWLSFAVKNGDYISSKLYINGIVS